MNIKGQKGQSSSVFNLLIAALVSLAILGLLLGIMGGIGFNQGNDPAETAVTQLKNASNGNSDYTTKSSEITFSKKANQIVKATLGESTALGKENIFLGLCDNVSSRITLESEDVIKYSGTSDFDAMIHVVCGHDGEELNKSINRICSGVNFSSNGSYNCVVVVGPK